MNRIFRVYGANLASNAGANNAFNIPKESIITQINIYHYSGAAVNAFTALYTSPSFSEVTMLIMILSGGTSYVAIPMAVNMGINPGTFYVQIYNYGVNVINSYDVIVFVKD